jgi:hypothetical protein
MLPKFGFRLLVARYVEALQHELPLSSVEYVLTQLKSNTGVTNKIPYYHINGNI